MGHVIHDFITDKEGNKIYQYFKTIQNEDGTFEEIIVSEDTGDPVLKFTRAPYEGLYYAVVGTLKDVFTMKFSKIKNAEQRNRKVLLAFTDLALIFLLLKYTFAILEAWIIDNGTDGLEGTTVSMMASVNKKVLNEYNV